MGGRNTTHLLNNKKKRKEERMRRCRWYYGESNECWIDCPDSMYPCLANGDLDKCPHIDLNGKPLKESEYCTEKD